MGRTSKKQEFGDVQEVSIEELDELLPMIRLTKAWIAAVERRLQDAALSGKKLKNAQLVLTQTHRQWKPGEEALIVALLMDHGMSADEVSPRTLISPAQAEKLYGNGFNDMMRDVIIKPPGNPVLADLKDTRLPYTPQQSAKEAFKTTE